MIRERRSREYIDNYSTCVRVVKKLSCLVDEIRSSGELVGDHFLRDWLSSIGSTVELSIELWKRRLTFHDTRVDGSSVEFSITRLELWLFEPTFELIVGDILRGEDWKEDFFDRKRVNYVSLFSKHVPSHLREWIKFEWPLENACRWNESAQFPSKILSRMCRFREY